MSPSFTAAPSSDAARTTRGAASLVVMAAIIQQLGAATAVTVFPALGAVGIVAVRFTVASAVLCLLARPRIRGLAPAQWGCAAGLAAALTAMSLLFYNASGRIPLGIAVTIEVCGPLALSVAVSHRRVAMLWALLAFAGVAALAIAAGEVGRVDIAGYLLAAGAAAGWAGYIMASTRAARVFAKVDALAWATLIGAAVTVPCALLSGTFHTAPSWSTLGTVVAVAIMSSVVPHSLEMVSLRRLPPATFAILTSLSPVMATLIGWAVLGQRLNGLHYLAIVLVTVASVGAVTQRPNRVPAGGAPPLKQPARRRRLRHPERTPPQ